MERNYESTANYGMIKNKCKDVFTVISRLMSERLDLLYDT